MRVDAGCGTCRTTSFYSISGQNALLREAGLPGQGEPRTAPRVAPVVLPGARVGRAGRPRGGHGPRRRPCRHESRAAALARAVGRLWEVGRPLGHLPVVVAPGRASPRLAVLGRRRAYRRGSRVAADSEACTMDGHGDPPVGRGASVPFCRNGTILAHGRIPLGPRPRDKFHSLSSGHIV